MMKLTVSVEMAPAIIAGLIKEGVTFEACEKSGVIEINFTGGF